MQERPLMWVGVVREAVELCFWAFCTNARTSFWVAVKVQGGCWDERSGLENTFAPERAKSKKANTDHGWWFSIFHQVSAMQELCIILWIGWYEKISKNHLYDCARRRRGCSTNWSLSRRTPGKEVALIWHHIMNMRATRRKIIIEMLNFFPKTISFKCKMAPNDNIPVNICDVLQKRAAVAWWTVLLWKSGIVGIVLVFTGDGSLLNCIVVQPGQEAIESRAG